MSPTEPAGKRLSLAPMPVQAIIYKFLAPVLSAQFMTDATGSELVIFSLIPLRPPLAKHDATQTNRSTNRVNHINGYRLRVCLATASAVLTYLFYSLIDSVY